VKPASTAAKNAVQRDHAVSVQTRLFAEWEHNRFSVPTVTVSPAQNTTPDPSWVTFYDLDTVALPNRPATGLAKARLGTNKVKPSTLTRDVVNGPRFYPSDASDPYKYWSSFDKTKLTVAGDGGYEFNSPIVVTVIYPAPVAANKVVVGFETSYSKPKTWSIQVSSDGTNWSSVTSNPVLDADGQASRWLNENHAWTDVPDYENPALIKAVRIQVYSMIDPYAHLDVLQIGARLENDLSPFLISYDREFDVADHSFIAPLGKASSNQASVQLSNTDLRFDNSNAGSLYFGLIDKKVKMTLDVGIVLPDDSVEWFREFTMWTENWGGQEQTTATVSLKDSSVVLQEAVCPPVFFESATIGACIWQVLDMIGFSDYNYTRADDETGQVLPYFWPESDNTVWDLFAQVAEATQTAVYFDEYNVLQIRTRKDMYGADRPVDWTFDAVPNGLKLPDIAEMQIDHSLETNKVDVVYKPAAFADFNNGFPKMETVWEPDEDTVVLRATPLLKDLTPTSTELWINQAEASFWLYSSLVNIQGEILKYNGKEYAYYQANGTVAKKVVKSEDEKNACDQISPDNSWKNTFTGRLIIELRGEMGTPASSHVQRSANYTGLVTNYENTKFHPDITIGSYQNGFFRVSPADTDITTYNLVKSDTSVLDLNTVTYGTKLRFPNTGASQNTAGIFFAGDWGDAGYWLEISPTEVIDTYESRTWRHELSLIAMPGNAPHQPVISNYNSYGDINGPGFNSGNGQPNDRKGWPHAIVTGKWYAIDVKWVYTGATSAYIMVFVDGVLAGDWFIGTQSNTAIAPPPNEGRFGMFVRGNTTADFEYLYASAGEPPNGDLDSSSFLDLVSGGFTSGYIERDWRYDFREISPFFGGNFFPQMVSRAQYVFDEFGPVIHEVRELEVKFKEENIPVASSFPYLSNPAAMCLAYEYSAFGAKMLLVGAGRENVIVKGDDEITFGVDDPVSQTFFVYGVCLYSEDERTLTKKDDAGIRQRGITATKFDSRFIQTEESANALGQWVLDLWGSGVEEVSLSVFGNPFIQLGDLVTVNYPVKGIHPTTHKYFVVSIKNSLSGGFTTDVVLRRANI
jgi:hypothetical protein